MLFEVKCSKFISVGVTLKFNGFTGIIQFKCQCGKSDFFNRSKLDYCSSYLGLRQFLQWTFLMRLSYCFLLTLFLHSYVYCEIYLLNVTRDIPKITHATINIRVNYEHVFSYVTLTLFYTTYKYWECKKWTVYHIGAINFVGILWGRVVPLNQLWFFLKVVKSKFNDFYSKVYRVEP